MTIKSQRTRTLHSPHPQGETFCSYSRFIKRQLSNSDLSVELKHNLIGDDLWIMVSSTVISLYQVEEASPQLTFD